MTVPLSQFPVVSDLDVARAGEHARVIADRLGLSPRDGAGLALVVSGLAADLARAAGGGRLAFEVTGDPAQSLRVRVGPPAPGGFEGRAWDVARRIMDEVSPGDPAAPDSGLVMSKALPRPAPAADLEGLAADLLRGDSDAPPGDPLARDLALFEALDRLEARERELAQARLELEDTNKAVMTLFLELGDQAESLRRASELKNKFLSNVSHELRTPLSSILSLARLLFERSDGELSTEQGRQVNFILRSAQDLAGLVNDLLDLARIEAGREVFHISEVDLGDLFGSLRGMLRPLLPPGSRVGLTIADPAGLPPIVTDERKLAQILRNFLSNALKFTEAGEVRLGVEQGPGGSVVFSVSDTGIGIAREHLARIFEEFGQVDGPLQRQVKGTGLGLPLARKLARLLGGDVQVRSEPGVGSTFTATIPARFPGDSHQDSPDG